jgi:hypothetical protein
MKIISAHVDGLTNVHGIDDVAELIGQCDVALLQEVSLSTMAALTPLADQSGYRCWFSPYGPAAVDNVGLGVLWKSCSVTLAALEHVRPPPIRAGRCPWAPGPPANIAQTVTFQGMGRMWRIINYRVPAADLEDGVPLELMAMAPDARRILCLSGIHNPDGASIVLAADGYVNACVCGAEPAQPQPDAIFFHGMETLGQYEYSTATTKGGMRYAILHHLE